MRDNRIRLALIAAFISSLFSMRTIGADDPPPITEKDLNTSSSNLKRIVLAIHSYNDENSSFPGDILDKKEKPLLSWRVAILPYIEKGELYQQFKLDEPWDSENNKKLIEKMPKIYAPVRVKAKAGETFYQTMTGEGTLFVKHKPLYTLGGIPDGTSNTGLIFEASDPVIWTKPVDLSFDKDKPLPKLGGMFEGISHVGMCDGYVLKMRRYPDEKELRRLIMADDGEVIEIEKLRMPKGKS